MLCVYRVLPLCMRYPSYPAKFCSLDEESTAKYAEATQTGSGLGCILANRGQDLEFPGQRG